MNVRRLLLVLLSCAMVTFISAQTVLWSDIPATSARSYTDARKNLLPQQFRLVTLNKTETNRRQQQALRSGITPSINTGATFEIPLPDGKNLLTTLIDAPVLSAELQLAYPGIKTYQLINPVNKNVAARFIISDMGVSGLIFTDKGTAYINPLGPAYPGIHMIYYVKDIPATTPVACYTKENIANLRPMEVQAGDGKKRTFRLAVAATGEYTTWAGSQANALSYITTTVNDVTAIYERDNAISFTLVSNNSILYTNASTDPYATVSFPSNATLTSNQTAIDANIGTTNYDLGFVFNNGWNGGLAALGVVCNNSGKAEGSAGLNFGTGANPAAGPQGPIFDGTVAHEIGHEFSATHSYAANNGSCSGQTNGPTGWEPGGGSTIMAYAGSCTGNSYQNNTDLYFHAGNIAQIQSYAVGSATCAMPVVTGNHQPTVTVPAASYTIPISTPFTLSSTGSDLDGNTLYYTWEEMDAGLVTNLPPQSTNTSGPNFRSYPPSLTSSRTFPGIVDIVAGNSPTYEVLSSVARTMNFRVTARDEVAGAGTTGEANVAINVNGSAGPFVVTSQSSTTTWTANGSNTAVITWNVANTTAAPVSCTAVDILFSIDGGITYPYTLVSNTVNDGTETIVIPNLPTYQGRIKVQSRNNIFFNINSTNITLSSSCAAQGTVFTPSAAVTAPSGSASLDLTLAPQYGVIITPVSGQVAVTDPTSNLLLIDSATGNCLTYSNTFYYDSYSFTVNTQGSYQLKFTGPTGILMNLYTGTTYSTTAPCTNRIASSETVSSVTNTIYLGPTLTAVLTPGIYYTLVIGAAPSLFGGSTPALPAAYSIAVNSAPAGGNLYSGVPDPGGSFNYTYVIVDKATGLIKAFDAGSNLSNSGTYPTGSYTVYGLSYSNSVSAATLNSYVGGPFSNFSNDLLYSPGTVCGNLSKDNLVATVTAALPVQLLPLQAVKAGGSVKLSWATASEQNNNYFEIQRSADGVSFSKTLGKVTGAGNSNTRTDYGFTDNASEPTWNYYRVKQVDLDGKSTYTNIARVNFAEKYSFVITYPNPAKSVLGVEYDTQSAGQVNWSIIDGKGAVVKEAAFSTQPGRNLQQLDVSNLATGTYLLRTISNNEVLVSKFIKQ